MKYPFCVKYNGVYYPAGAEVPAGASPRLDKEKVAHEEPVVKFKADVKEEVLREEIVPKKAEEPKKPAPEPAKDRIGNVKISDTKIRTMKADDARNLAYSLGLEFQPDSTNAEIKAMLRHYYGFDKRK